jgi:hypothetical protein
MKNVLKRVTAMGVLAGCVGLMVSNVTSGVFHPDGATTMHFAFEGSPNGDRPIIRPPATYYPEDGFGFVNSPELVGTSRGVTAPKYFRVDVNVPAGTYDVKVMSGGVSQDAVFSINAEGKPTTVKDVKLAARQNQEQTFTVTVNHPEKPANDAPMEADGRLNLEFIGTNPSMMKLDISPAAKPG